MKKPIDHDVALPYLISVIDDDTTAPLLPDLTSGSFFTVLPEGTTETEAADLRWGWRLDPPPSRVYLDNGYVAEPLLSPIAEFMRELGRKGVAFIREPMFNFDDTFPAASRLADCVQIGSRPFRVFSLENCDSETAEAEVTEYFYPWIFLMIVSDVDVGERRLQQIFARASLIAVHAHGGQGFLCCTRRA